MHASQKPVLVLCHAPQEGLGSFEDVFEEDHIPWISCQLDQGDPCPRASEPYQALIVMGGPMGVYETRQFPFLKSEIRLLKDALQHEVPVLGICLGAQLLATAGGASVYRGSQQEIGWYPVQVAPHAKADQLFSGMPKQFMAFHWHQDTFDLPKEGILLASSRLYQRQAFRLGRCAWGVQFHPEVNRDIVTSWTKGFVAEEGHPTAQQIRKNTPLHLATCQKRARQFTERFLRLTPD